MNFITRLPISANWNSDSYDFILVIVDRLTKIVHYELVKVTINAQKLVEVHFVMLVWDHRLPNSIQSNRGSLFILKF